MHKTGSGQNIDPHLVSNAWRDLLRAQRTLRRWPFRPAYVAAAPASTGGSQKQVVIHGCAGCPDRGTKLARMLESSSTSREKAGAEPSSGPSYEDRRMTPNHYENREIARLRCEKLIINLY